MNTSACRFTKDHEWACEDGAVVRVGISDYAQRELGDVVFVDLPKAGQTVSQGKSFCTVESVKAVSDIYAPLSGEIVNVNEALSATPELINSSATDKGWICTIKPKAISELESLMNSTQYDVYVKEVSK